MNTLTTQTYEKNASNKWELVSTAAEEYNTHKWNEYIIGSIKYFRSLGGKETLENCYKLVSINPDKSIKVIRTLTQGEQK